MRERLLLVVLFVLAAMGCASEQVNPTDVNRANKDPFDALKGKWDGYWEWDPWFRASGRGKQDLALRITSIRGTGSSREVSGTMTQMNGESPLFSNASVSGTAELSGGWIVVRVSTSWGQRMKLTLRGDLLLGDGTASGPQSLHAPHRVQLKKVMGKNPETLFRQSRAALLVTIPPEGHIPDMQSIEGSWRRFDRTADGMALARLLIYSDGDVRLLFDSVDYPLQARIEGGKIFWTFESRSGTMTLYEGDGKRVLRMAIGDSTIADYVPD